MRTNPLSVYVALAAGWAATLMSTGGIAAEADAEILAFRRDQSPYASYDWNLREIDPVATYQVRMYHGYDPEQPITMSGSDLARLNVTIGQRPGSVIVEYGQQK